MQPTVICQQAVSASSNMHNNTGHTTVVVSTGLGLCPARQTIVKLEATRFDSKNELSSALLTLQRAAEAGRLSALQADAIAFGTNSVPHLLNATDVNSLFNSPVEVVAFSDEEGIR